MRTPAESSLNRRFAGVPTAITTRRATLDDLDILVADVQAGFDSYTEFAPPGWEPPDMHRDRYMTAQLLVDPATWGLIAEVDDAPVGHIAFFPARERPLHGSSVDWRTRPLIPALAHLWQLFILPDWWGRGIAPILHDAATAEMRSRGFKRVRLYTPSSHARARRFYERRGWTAGDEQWNEYLALQLTEYWLELDRSP
jgi:GNAT superfamily N-acetyltransferase